MILTKDNLLKFVREKKYVTPTTVAEGFETTTMIASAALSEIAKEKLISITHLKTASSPYYYDHRQKEALKELADKHFKNYDKEAYFKIKDEEVVNDAQLTIQLRLAIERIKDFAIPLNINYEGKELKFWIWYMRNIDETRRQIMEVLNPKKGTTKTTKKTTTKKASTEVKQTVKEEVQFVQEESSSESKEEQVIENYFKTNYLKLESKNKEEKNIHYSVSVKINKITVYFDCLYYGKKPTDSDIMRFYASSPKPKIVFISNAPKKFFKLAEGLENLTVVSL